MTNFNIRQQMLTLSFIAYSGFYEVDEDDQAMPSLARKIRQYLETMPSAQGWKLAWGPDADRFWFNIFDDNVMFVAERVGAPHELAIAIRGTDPVSLPTWIIEDFSVLRKVPWRFGANASDARLSHGTHVGLRMHSKMRAKPGVAAAGSSLKEFLRDWLARLPPDGPEPKVHVTGHSLGGALSPVVALWLADTQGPNVAGMDPTEVWDEATRVQISVTAFAGPTPGNAALARRIEAGLGGRIDRVFNPLDVVPHGWKPALMATIPDLYAPTLRMSLPTRALWAVVHYATRHLDYEHPVPEAPSMEASVWHDGKDYLLQAAYQHVVAYAELLGLREHDLEGQLFPHAARLGEVLAYGRPRPASTWGRLKHAINEAAASALPKVESPRRSLATLAQRWTTRA